MGADCRITEIVRVRGTETVTAMYNHVRTPVIKSKSATVTQSQNQSKKPPRKIKPKQIVNIPETSWEAPG